MVGGAGVMEEQSGSARRISNEGLTELALNAAIQLDRRLHRQDSANEIVTEFLDVLGRIVDVSPDQTTGKLISDPRKVGVVDRAFRHLNRSVPTVQELIANIKALSDSHRNAAASPDDITRLRDFCIALHKELLAHAYMSYIEERKREGVAQNATGFL